MAASVPLAPWQGISGELVTNIFVPNFWRIAGGETGMPLDTIDVPTVYLCSPARSFCNGHIAGDSTSGRTYEPAP